MARYASGKHAYQHCDICGFRYKYGTLKEIYEKDTATGILACPPCWNPSHPQLRQGEQDIVDPQTLREARPDNGQDQSRVITVDDEAAARALGIYDQLHLPE